jgi:hypothetical protein
VPGCDVSAAHLCAFATASFGQHKTFLQLCSTRIYPQLHATPNIQLLLESDPWWWSYTGLKLGQLHHNHGGVARPANWLVSRTGTVLVDARAANPSTSARHHHPMLITCIVFAVILRQPSCIDLEPSVSRTSFVQNAVQLLFPIIESRRSRPLVQRNRYRCPALSG